LRAIGAPATRGEARPEPPLIYLDQVADDVADAYQTQIIYEITGDNVRFRLRLFSLKDSHETMFTTTAHDPATLAERIVAELVRMLASVSLQ
jgi:hypothetical protein